MSYSVGQKITASSANELFSIAKSVYNDSNQGAVTRPAMTFGYGQTVPGVDLINVGDTITGENWSNMLSAIKKAAQHQGTTLGASLPNQVNIGDIVSIIPQLQNSLTSISSNRLNAGTASLAIVGKGTVTRTAAWTNSISQTVTVNFTSWDRMRYFFNTGGEIRVSYNLSGASNRRSLYWQELFDTMGHIVLDHSRCFSTGLGQTFNLGAYDLTATDRKIFEYNSGSGMYAYLYTSDLLEVKARFNGAPGSATSIIITVTLVQGSGANEIVTGVTLTANAQERRANNTGVTIPTNQFNMTNFT